LNNCVAEVQLTPEMKAAGDSGKPIYRNLANNELYNWYFSQLENVVV